MRNIYIKSMIVYDKINIKIIGCSLTSIFLIVAFTKLQSKILSNQSKFCYERRILTILWSKLL